MKKTVLAFSSVAFMFTATNAVEVGDAIKSAGTEAVKTTVEAVKSAGSEVVTTAVETTTSAASNTTTVTTAESTTPKAATGAATEVKMKIKAKENSGLVKVKAGITHDMLTYDQAKKKGKEANFITHITATVGDKVVYDASTSQFLSKNPLIKFQFNGKKDEEIKITYTQLNGETFYATKKVK